VLGRTNSRPIFPSCHKNKTKQNKTMSMLSVELWTCRASLLLVTVRSSTAMPVALFMDHNRKSFVTCYDPRDMSKS
jgi:hypothetical protein